MRIHIKLILNITYFMSESPYTPQNETKPTPATITTTTATAYRGQFKKEIREYRESSALLKRILL